MRTVVDALGFLRCLAFLTLVLSCILLGCERPRMLTQSTGDDWFETKHRWRTATAEGWKAEVWLWGSTFDRDERVTVNVRLTPENQELKTMPPVALNLAISKKGEKVPLRQANPKPDWQECAKMKKRRENTFEDGRWGNTVDFPPKEPCWEAVVLDPFKSDRRLPDTAPFETGDYLLTITIVIDGGPKFHFENLEITILKGPEPPKSETAPKTVKEKTKRGNQRERES